MVIPTDAAMRERLVWEALATIPDPEIPAISLVDLGVIGDVRVDDDGALARVELLPTFVGCPAIEVMRQHIAERLTELAIAERVEVAVSFATPWTSERISDAGRERLRRSGFAPPVMTAGRQPRRARRPADRRVPVLRVAQHGARQRIRADAVSRHLSLCRLPAAVRTVQARLTGPGWSPDCIGFRHNPHEQDR